jgi:23S rRNA (cytosine1962-C5)-methyltransferase
MMTLTLKPREHLRLRGGHLWVFTDELTALPEAEPGTVVRVVTHDGVSYGTGFYNPQSKIAVRLLGTEEERIDAEFIASRLRSAQLLRERVLPGESAYRVVFGESDLMSGLIIDRFGDHFTMQMLSAGFDRLRDEIVTAIRDVFPHVHGIIERNTARTRLKEGLDLRDGILFGDVPEHIEITENGLKIIVDLAGGQKTGYFLDQKVNRRIAASFAHGRSVLDCFCNVGGFALNAAAAGATEVLGVDSSASAVEAAERNARHNGLEHCAFQTANVFDVLRAHADEGRVWDVVILDPPSFAKTRGAIPRAKAGYAELHRAALRVVAPGGVLISSSCTQLVPEDMLLEIIEREAARNRRRLRLLHRGSQAPDHPVLLAMPETQYLKFLVFDTAGSC